MKNPQAPAEPKTYVTTERAGFVVAGRRVPPVYEAGKPAQPTVGFELTLLDLEAEYELAQQTIALKPESPESKKAEKATDKTAAPAAEKAS